MTKRNLSREARIINAAKLCGTMHEIALRAGPDVTASIAWNTLNRKRYQANVKDSVKRYIARGSIALIDQEP